MLKIPVGDFKTPERTLQTADAKNGLRRKIPGNLATLRYGF